MRLFVKIGAILLCALQLISCGARQVDICELMQRLCEESGGENGKGILYFNQTRNSQNEDFEELSYEDFGFLYSGKREPPVCANRITGYAVRLSLDGDGYEIHIIECANPSDTEEISEMLLKRVERLQGAEILQYAPQTYEMYFRGAQVYARGKYAFLLATPDNKAVIEAIDRAL
ncbi:MAG: hypothetical protein IKB51_01605 [Clostridia bacterium]|nr:hypothetical protein [Clostridia bacterium]